MGNKHRVGLLFALLFAMTCQAYEVETHVEMTSRAVNNSALPLYLQNLGIADLLSTLPDNTIDVVRGFAFTLGPHPPELEVFSLPRCIPGGADTKRSIINLTSVGAFCEDALFTTGNEPIARFTNHFFDPVHGGDGLNTTVATYLSSLVWGLESVGPILGQNYSYADFRRYIYLGVTSKSPESRKQFMVLAFRTLGHVAHLIEDLAQPQHTRNDSHAVGSAYEIFINQNRQFLSLDGYDSGQIHIANAQSVWHTVDRKGLADYSNAGFVTEGTNFHGKVGAITPDGNYALPNGGGAVLHLVEIADPALSADCPGTQLPFTLHGMLYFIETPVADNLAGSISSNPRTSTYSIFDEDLRHHGLRGVFSLNRFTYCSAEQLLVPRAVGYATAFINYAIRGKIEVSASDDGVYAIDNVYRPFCVDYCGFEKLKVLIRNATLGTDQMQKGRLVAVARYHRNTCYLADLSGQPKGPEFLGVACRDPAADEALNEFVSISKPIDVNSISSTDKSPFSFDFSKDPVPFSASDLYLQVVFQGQLGEEMDGVAVGSVDLFEPTFITFNDDNDYIPIYGADGKFLRTDRYAPAVGETPNRYSIVDLKLSTYSLEGKTLPTLASFDRLDPGYFKRVAVLNDHAEFVYRIDYRFGNSAPTDVITQSYDISNALLQLDEGRVWNYYPDYIPLRHSTPDDWIYHPSQDGSTVYWLPGYECADSSPCTPEETTVGEQVQRYPPFAQPTPQPMTIDFNDRP